MQQDLFVIRDKRDKGWFWMDNEYLNGYARHFGAIGTAIYVCLCRHAHYRDQVCFPSQEGIAEELNISVRTVRKYIKLFETFNLIKVDRQKDAKKRQLANVYILLDKSVWKKPQATNASGVEANNNQKPQATIASQRDTSLKRHILKEKINKIGRI